MTEIFGTSGASSIAECIANAAEVDSDPHSEIMEDCPVHPVGYISSDYFFITRCGDLQRIAAQDFTDKRLMSLFSGDVRWLKRRFPAYDKQGEPRDDFSGRTATAELMRACHRSGYYNIDMPLRGHGVWRDGSGAALHTGDKVFMNGNWVSPGRISDDAIYVERAAVAKPDFDCPLSDVESRELRQWLNNWAFRDKGDADLLFGFLGAALLGGFPGWRVHALVTGERGTGKSELGEFLMECLGPQGTSMNNYTEAGLRQKLQNEARALWLDEGETGHEYHSSRMVEVIRLLRLLSGGQGAKIVRGSSGGAAQCMTVTGCVMITAINPPHLEPQDRSRIIEINLDKPPSRETTEQDLSYFRSEARKRSSRLRARAFLRCDHFRAAFSLFRRVLVTHGCDGRQADMFATLLAGRSILLDPVAPSQEQADALVEKHECRLREVFLEDGEDSDGQICLKQIYDFIVDSYRGDRRPSMGQLLAAAVTGEGEESALQAYGLRVIRENGLPCLFVSNSHLQLRRVFAGTVWSRGGWTKSLRRLPGVVSSRSVRVAGTPQRGVIVPYDLMPHSRQDYQDHVDDHPPPHL